MRTNCIVVFAKYPQKNKVKTRLAKTLGAESAAALYGYFVESTVSNVRKTGADVFMNITPENTLGEFKKWLGEGLFYMAQEGGDLGERLSSAFKALFGKGYKKVVALGADTPDLPLEFIAGAYDSLSYSDAVIGPAEDGGYYLIGLRDRALCPKLFGNIEWGTGTVFDDTVGLLEKNNASYAVFPEWQDIDTAGDLRSFYSRIKTGGISPVRL